MEIKSKPKIPKLLMGTYEVLDKIGSGSFGIAYRARNINTNQEVAIKLVSEVLMLGTT
jgi:serine/threonine protein kinase